MASLVKNYNHDDRVSEFFPNRLYETICDFPEAVQEAFKNVDSADKNARHAAIDTLGGYVRPS